jgi:vacuolar-type H+-ATPase subunit E/Vma4
MSERLAELLARLSRQADDQIAALRADGSASAERVLQEALHSAERSRDTRLAERERALSAETAALLESERLAGRQELLEASSQAVEQILARVVELLPTVVEHPLYRAVVGAELLEAMAVLPRAAGELRITPAIADWIRDRVPTTITTVADPDVIGFRLFSEDRRIEVDGTLRKRFERERPGLAVAAAAELERKA